MILGKSKLSYANDDSKMYGTFKQWAQNKFGETRTRDPTFGFIECHDIDKQVFVHITNIKSENLNEGDIVQFDIGYNKGRPCAFHVETIEDNSDATKMLALVMSNMQDVKTMKTVVNDCKQMMDSLKTKNTALEAEVRKDKDANTHYHNLHIQHINKLVQDVQNMKNNEAEKMAKMEQIVATKTKTYETALKKILNEAENMLNKLISSAMESIDHKIAQLGANKQAGKAEWPKLHKASQSREPRGSSKELATLSAAA